MYSPTSTAQVVWAITYVGCRSGCPPEKWLLWTTAGEAYFVTRGGSRIPCRRGRQPSGGGGRAATYDFVKFSKKLHEIEKILDRGGGGGGGVGGARRVHPLNPPLVTNIKYIRTNVCVQFQENVWCLCFFEA